MWKESVSFISPSGIFGQKGKHPGLDWAERENSRLSLGASISVGVSQFVQICS